MVCRLVVRPTELPLTRSPQTRWHESQLTVGVRCAPMTGEPRGRVARGIRVLVVEDDPLFRRMLHALLDDDGYTVLDAPNGVVALDRLQHTAEPLVVVVNHQMPRLDGPGLLRAVLADPQLYGRHAFLYTTATDGRLAPTLQRQLEELRAPLLRKPFDLVVFLDAVAAGVERLSQASEPKPKRNGEPTST
jgi:CheY-like chemotaxis protein